jgi:dienelactone hydrolase
MSRIEVHHRPPVGYATALLPRPRDYLNAVALLLRFERGSAAEPSRFGIARGRTVETSEASLDTELGSVRAQRFEPAGAKDPPGLLLVHGVHPDGIDEPRLRHFAGVMASAGYRVLVPEVRTLCRYELRSEAVALIGSAARSHARSLERRAVGVLGVSFGGGLSLQAAADPSYQPSIGFVLAIGAHHDAHRVLSFFAGATVEGPEGEAPAADPHLYGMALFVYARLGELFAPADRDPAARALRPLLVEDIAGAEAALPDLSEAGRHTLEALMGRRDRTELERRVRERLEVAAPELRDVSPAGKLASVECPVYLLHGAGDTVIPATETRWLAHEIPAPCLKAAVVSPFLGHADREPEAGWSERLRLVHLMARVLAEGRSARHARAAPGTEDADGR